MFRLRGRKHEAKETGSRSPEESQGVEVVEDEGNGGRLAEVVNDLVEHSAALRLCLQSALFSKRQLAMPRRLLIV